MKTLWRERTSRGFICCTWVVQFCGLSQQGVHGATEVLENVPAAQPVTQLVDAVEPGAEVNGGAHWLHWDAFAGDH